ncbi:hypothetical protein KDA_68480 [Dictyobacter alpinus]|uniref:DUF2690 domain-containing protein n=1 Tax=Dictyobacter alpinus TaxID=2014873 RepID=A0A402BIZ1_9CHLR|nr:DUF2690 domain-containing protein [Dictyobacter alpinus]GCE31364.1 hypothetical protein KDA_68480 [Dictyobacter alpinus]
MKKHTSIFLSLLFVIICSSVTLLAPAVASAAPASPNYDTQTHFVLTGIKKAHAITKSAHANYICGTNCNNQNPQDTQCAQGAQTVLSAYITDPYYGGNWGLLELRWSPTCGTNWTRITSYQGTRQLYAIIEHPAGQDGGYAYYTSGNVVATQTWSKMVYSPNDPVKSIGDITVRGQASVCIANTGLSC